MAGILANKLSYLIRNVSHTPEQLLRNEIGEPNFIERPVVLPDSPIPPLAPPSVLATRPLPQIQATAPIGVTSTGWTAVIKCKDTLRRIFRAIEDEVQEQDD